MEVLLISFQKSLLQFFSSLDAPGCSTAYQPVQLSRNLLTKPCDRPSAALCNLTVEVSLSHLG